ncbi:MAG: hypothetical protein HOI53_01730 [Francisellaceae bacterium]|jgi:hypothetical protein|nr:hypothetical protein [Francisellaceae bacterium]MBT6206723.1 hypothetical protein [Francisellaceae bacterium]MBT6537928.1 hypothetical protein [Francisellaceae bacterium]
MVYLYELAKEDDCLNLFLRLQEKESTNTESSITAALFCACRERNVAAAAFLIIFNANAYKQEATGKCPIDFLSELEVTEMVKFCQIIKNKVIGENLSDAKLGKEIYDMCSQLYQVMDKEAALCEIAKQERLNRLFLISNKPNEYLKDYYVDYLLKASKHNNSYSATAETKHRLAQCDARDKRMDKLSGIDFLYQFSVCIISKIESQITDSPQPKTNNTINSIQRV